MIFYGKQYRGKAFVEHRPIGLIGPISPIGPISLIGLIGPISPIGPMSLISPIGPIGPIAPLAHTLKRIIAQMMPKMTVKY